MLDNDEITIAKIKYENLLYCKGCGNTLTTTYRKNHNNWTINCNRYSIGSKRRMCEPHFIPYDKLEVALLVVIKKTCKQYLEYIDIYNIANDSNNRKKIILRYKKR